MANPYFNAVYYLENNPDVGAAGYTVDTAENHYLQFGAREAAADKGALGADQRKPAPWFDVQYYLSAHPDLIINGVEPAAAFEHFTTYGIDEARAPMNGLLVDHAALSTYATANSDLLTAFGIEDPTNLDADQQNALAHHFYNYGYKETRPGAPSASDISTITLEAQGWSSGMNNVSFSLEFASDIRLSDVYLAGGGTASFSAETIVQDGVTTVTAHMSLLNGKPADSIGVDLVVPRALRDDASIAIQNFKINNIEYPDASSAIKSGSVIFKFTDLITKFAVIDETSATDSSGYDTHYSHINDVFSLPASKAGIIEAGSVANAYLHIDPGERFTYDHDTFVLRADSTANYRLKFSPEDPSLFNSNIISWLYGADGSLGGLTMNLIGGKSSFVDGSLYSSSFALQAGEDKYLSLAMRWSSDDVMDVANGPAGYQVELVKLVGVDAFDAQL